MNKHNCMQLHETVVKDVFDIVSHVKNYDQVDWIRSKSSSVGSIAKRAANLTLVFPVIVSTNLDINTAMIVSKAIERKCCSLLQILFSAAQITSEGDLANYLRQFHTNLDMKNDMDLGEFMDLMDRLVDEEAITIDKDTYDLIKEDMQNINYMLSTDFNPVSINDYKIGRSMLGESTVMLEVDAGKAGYYNRGEYQSGYNNRHGNNSGDNNKYAHYDTSTGNRGDWSGSDNTIRYGVNSGKNNTYQDKSVHVTNHYGNGSGHNKSASSMKDYTDYFGKQLLATDIKKANELMPTTMIVNFIYTGENNDQVISMSGVIGVKAKMYPVDSIDICNRIISKSADKNGLFNLVRASTREISFFKDLAFAIEKSKLDATYMANDSNNARMFKVLERRAAKNRFTRLIKKNDASPITSLVLSQNEVEYLKQLNVDLEKSYAARTILEAYNLMDIVVADETMEIAKFLFDDGDGTYESLTFSSLEKEASDNSYKKVVNLLSKVNR